MDKHDFCDLFFPELHQFFPENVDILLGATASLPLQPVPLCQATRSVVCLICLLVVLIIFENNTNELSPKRLGGLKLQLNSNHLIHHVCFFLVFYHMESYLVVSKDCLLFLIFTKTLQNLWKILISLKTLFWFLR